MDKIKTAIVGVGSIAQIVHLPVLRKMEDVELVALCDVDEAKVTKLIEKYRIPRGYGQLDNMLRAQEIDALHICTISHYHFPMAYLALSSGVNVFVEKPLALNAQDADKLLALAKKQDMILSVGMQNRFRDDVAILKQFIDKGELGEIFYIKAGWLRSWGRSSLRDWQKKKQFAGGGVMMDMGLQLIDLALFLSAMPRIKSVRLYDYSLDPQTEVEDAALAVIETQSGMSITIEVSWKMHLEKDMIYTHIFGKEGAAYLNPLRINKELHGNLVNVTPLSGEMSSVERFKKAYENEIHYFYHVLRGEEKNLSSAEDACYMMRLLDALYESGRKRDKVELS